MKSIIQTSLIVTLLAGLMMFSCQSDNVQPNNNPPNIRPITATELEVIDASNNFAFDMINELNKEANAENLFISPFSISSALSMLLNGAEGVTKSQIAEVLDVDDMTDEQINNAYSSLVNYLYGLDDQVELSIANANWLRDGLTLNADFKQTLNAHYDAELRTVDFSRADAAEIINDWIEQKTNNKIKDMLDEVPSDAVMYLINAIYFNADWKYQFDKELTKQDNFIINGEQSVQTDMMTTKGALVNYSHADDFLYFEIPYGIGQYKFTVVLPNYDHDVNAIMATLDADKLAIHSAQSDTATVKLIMPKFKLAYKKLLNNALKSLGMVNAFSDKAELNGLVEEMLELYVSRVIHQSFLEVSEEGTEAAAATVVEIRETSIPVGPQKPEVITLNRPFIFFITEEHSKTILFAGKLMNPEKG